MAIQESSTFECPSCDMKAPSTAVPYDPLGYVVCPACTYSGGPGE